VRKRKNMMAFYEAFSKTKLKRPDEPVAVGTKPYTVAAPTPTAAATPPAKPVKPTVQPGWEVFGEPIVSTAGKRLRLSLTQGHCITAGSALVVLLILSFILGRASVPKEAPPPEEQADAMLMIQAAPDTQTTQPPKAQLPPPTTRTRIPGKFYLVIQQALGSAQQQEADSRAIVAWLREQDEPATVARFDNRAGFFVWSLTGFDSPTGEDAIKYAQSIELLGRKYGSEGGKYKFKQRDPNRPWFIPYSSN